MASFVDPLANATDSLDLLMHEQQVAEPPTRAARRRAGVMPNAAKQQPQRMSTDVPLAPMQRRRGSFSAIKDGDERAAAQQNYAAIQSAQRRAAQEVEQRKHERSKRVRMQEAERGPGRLSQEYYNRVDGLQRRGTTGAGTFSTVKRTLATHDEAEAALAETGEARHYLEYEKYSTFRDARPTGGGWGDGPVLPERYHAAPAMSMPVPEVASRLYDSKTQATVKYREAVEAGVVYSVEEAPRPEEGYNRPGRRNSGLPAMGYELGALPAYLRRRQERESREVEEDHQYAPAAASGSGYARSAAPPHARRQQQQGQQHPPLPTQSPGRRGARLEASRQQQRQHQQSGGAGSSGMGSYAAMYCGHAAQRAERFDPFKKPLAASGSGSDDSHHADYRAALPPPQRSIPVSARAAIGRDDSASLLSPIKEHGEHQQHARQYAPARGPPPESASSPSIISREHRSAAAWATERGMVALQHEAPAEQQMGRGRDAPVVRRTREEQQAVQWAAKAWKEVDAVQSDWLHVLKARHTAREHHEHFHGAAKGERDAQDEIARRAAQPPPEPLWWQDQI